MSRLKLVQNAHRHGGLKVLHVAYAAAPETVHVVVVNPASDSESVPAFEHAGEYVAEMGVSRAEHGHGLDLVDELSRAWGQECRGA